jgi:hypothetical protein
MSNQSPIYKFVSLRNPNLSESTGSADEVILSTALTIELSSIVSGNDEPNIKLENYNSALQVYIDSSAFIKTKSEAELLKTNLTTTPTEAGLKQIYDNIIVRSLTKSNTNMIYKILVDLFKSVYKALYPASGDISIIIPQDITPSFTRFIGENDGGDTIDTTPQEELLTKINNLSLVESLIVQAQKQNVVEFPELGKITVVNVTYRFILNYVKSESISVQDAKTKITADLNEKMTDRTENKIFNRTKAENMRSKINDELDQEATVNMEVVNRLNELLNQVKKLEEDAVETITTKTTIVTNKYDLVYTMLGNTKMSIDDAYNQLKSKMNELNNDLPSLITEKKYSLVGSNWIETSLFNHSYNVGSLGNHLITRPACDYKFPYQIADLRVVEQEPVGYLPGEIAHINNTQSGEKNTRVTRRLKRSETFESFLIEDETSRETDTQSTEKYSIENAAYDAQTNANSVSVNASASATYGPVSASVDAGYSNSNSSFSSNSSSQSEAKEIVNRIVDKVSHRVRSERSTTTIEEFEETVTHEINNEGQGTKSYVYRWLNKLVRATLKNYGKRLIFEFDVAHPAHFYLSRSITELPSLNIPPDPRKATIAGAPILTIDNITRDNYLAWATIYDAEIDQPPVNKIIVSEVINGTQGTVTGKLIQIPDNYKCVYGKATSYYVNGWPYGNSIVCSIGNGTFAFWNSGDNLWFPTEFWFSGETKQLPISVSSHQQGFYVNVEIHCDLIEEAYKAWKISAYNSIVAAYNKLLNDAENEMASFDPNRPGINPSKKEQLIKDEIKRETIRKMFRCNPFWIKDNFVVGKEYNPQCCADSLNAEKVKFLETVFDWNNMTYVLHPYFYSDKNNWKELLDLTDDNPHFESFMQASYATVRVPVFRDDLKELAAINFLQFNSIANYEVVPEEMNPLLDELRNNQPTLFTHDINGVELPLPVDTIDLGVFKIPTNLVMLECGNSDGIKPIGYPQSTDEPTSDVIIPKQYSPAIIADTCPTIQP